MPLAFLTDQDFEHGNIVYHQMYYKASSCLRDGTYVLIAAMCIMATIGVVANFLSITILKKLISRDVEYQIMAFILIAIGINDISFQVLFPSLVVGFQAHPEYIVQFDWYRDLSQPDDPKFGRDSDLLKSWTIKGRNFLKFSLQPGFMLNSLLLYLLLAYFLWHCAKLKSQFGAGRSEDVLKRHLNKFKLTTCLIPFFATAYAAAAFVLGGLYLLEKPVLFVSAFLLVAVCIPIVVLNYIRLKSVKALLKELEELNDRIRDSSSSSSEDDRYNEQQAPSHSERPPGLYLDMQKRPTSEHRVSDNSQKSSNIENRSQVTPSGSDNRASINKVRQKLDKFFRKQSVKASMQKSRSTEQLERRHNNWRKTAIVSSLCSVACVLPSLVYFGVKATTFFSREYSDDEWSIVCIGYIFLSSFYMIVAPINFFVNPFVYYFTNEEFRKTFRKTFPCFFCRKTSSRSRRSGTGFRTPGRHSAGSYATMNETGA